MDQGCSAIPQGNEAAPEHSVALQEASDCLKRFLELFDVGRIRLVQITL